MINCNAIVLSDEQRHQLMHVANTGRIPLVLDCDAGNEVDDQFALAWALLHSERLDVQAIYAAPYTNHFFPHEADDPTEVSDPEEGMHRSYDEIRQVLSLLPVTQTPDVFPGARHYLKDTAQPESNPAVEDLISRARNAQQPLHVVCVAAPTNVATALQLAPDIAQKIHILWLGGHSFDWCDTEEFNLMQDIAASRTLLDSGVALTLIPCRGAASVLATSKPEIHHYLAHTSRIGQYLTEITERLSWIGYAERKVIWDIANIGYLLNPEWFTTFYSASPRLNDNLTWSFDPRRHAIRVVKFIKQDALFADLFRTLGDADRKYNL